VEWNLRPVAGKLCDSGTAGGHLRIVQEAGMRASSTVNTAPNIVWVSGAPHHTAGAMGKRGLPMMGA